MTPHPIDTMPADMAEEDLALGGARTERLAAFAGQTCDALSSNRRRPITLILARQCCVVGQAEGPGRR
jgi:hypothetical protein